MKKIITITAIVGLLAAAAGQGNNLLMILGFALMVVGAVGFAGAKRITESLNEQASLKQ